MRVLLMLIVFVPGCYPGAVEGVGADASIDANSIDGRELEMTATDIPLECKEYRYQRVDSNGTTVTQAFVASLDVGGPAADVLVKTCPKVPFCPDGECGGPGEPPPIACVVARGGGFFTADNKLRIDCARVVTRTPTGGSPMVIEDTRGNYAITVTRYQFSLK